MKRRQFFSGAALGAAALTTGGCSMLGKQGPVIMPEIHKFDPSTLKVTVKKPSGGSIPVGELGTTGITVSKFAFGSHIPPGLIPLGKERRRMIHEAFDMGITTIDV